MHAKQPVVDQKKGNNLANVRVNALANTKKTPLDAVALEVQNIFIRYVYGVNTVRIRFSLRLLLLLRITG